MSMGAIHRAPGPSILFNLFFGQAGGYDYKELRCTIVPIRDIFSIIVPGVIPEPPPPEISPFRLI